MNRVPAYKVWFVIALLWPGISLGQSGNPSFPSIVPTGMPYTIIVEAATINTRGLAPGDSIGVFDGQTLVGKDAFQGNYPMKVSSHNMDHRQ